MEVLDRAIEEAGKRKVQKERQIFIKTSADFLLFWDVRNERHKCSTEIPKIGLKFFAIRPIQRRHKRKPPYKHINCFPRFPTGRPPHMAVYHSGGLILSGINPYNTSLPILQV